MSTLTMANQQWSTRPADQRFASLEDLHSAVSRYREMSREAKGMQLNGLRAAVAIQDGHSVRKLLPGEDTTQAEPVLVGQTGTQSQFTHYSFGQVARRIGAPAQYLRELPAPLAVANLNYGLSTLSDDETGNLMFAQNGSLRLRSALTDSYRRIWNSDITSRLLTLTRQQPEWQPAPAAFDGSRGLYASDADMFAFLVDNDRRIFEQGPGGGLGRGFFVWNSEVGDRSFGIMTFFYEYVCGNHRVWGAEGVQELRIRHVGNADERAFQQLRVELRKYADSSTHDDELKVASMRRMQLGATKDEVLDAVFKLDTGLSKARLSAAYVTAEEEEAKYGNPRSVWGYTGGLTQLARDLPNTSDRVAMERAASKIMAVAF